ncbi:MAG: PilC/PilY family type IV pilus protein [Pseudomonadota bacterium]
MNTWQRKTIAALGLGAAGILAASTAAADDVDIFTGASAGTSINPRILIVLDNTSNWSRQSQQWPGGVSQGQSEANAIKTVLASLDGKVNLGLMEFVTGGNANQDGGYIRAAVKPMNPLNKSTFSTSLTTIYNNVTSPDEKRNANTPFGNLMYDAYNYYAGADSHSPTAVISSLADPDGYSARYATFASPLTADNTCGKSFIIFIGNPDARGPTSDDAANTAALAGLGGTTTQLGLPNFSSANVTLSTNLGNTAQCYPSTLAAAAGLGDYATQCATYTEGCSVGGPVANTSPIACPAGQLSYSVIRSQFIPASTTSASTSPVVGAVASSSAATTGVYASSSVVDPNADHGTLVCPAASTTVAGNVSTAVSYSCSYAVGAAVAGTSSSGTSINSVVGSTTTSSAPTTAYYSGAGAFSPASDHGTLACPANTSSTSGGVTTSVTYACSYATGSATGATAPSTSVASAVVTSAPSTAYYTSAGAVDPATDHGTLTCPAGTSTTSGGNSTAVSYACSYSTGAATGTTSTGSPTVTSGTTTSSYGSAAAVNPTSDHGTLICPANNTCTYATGAPVSPSTTSSATTSACYRDVSGGTGVTYWVNVTDNAGLTCPSGNTCAYSGANGGAGSCGGTGGNIMNIRVTQTATPNTSRYTVTQTATPITSRYMINQSVVATTTVTTKYNVTLSVTPTTTTTTSTSTAKYTITQSATPTTTVTTTTTTPASTVNTTLGYTSQCYPAAPTASTGDFASECSGTNVSCTYNNAPSAPSLGQCPAGNSVYSVIGTNITLTNVATGSSSTDTNPFNADEWARFMHDKGVPVAGSAVKPSITTYTIDVYNKQPNAQHTSLLLSMAKAGGGKYFAAKNEQAIVDALKQIVTEILAVNTSFASTSLPVNATNRSQNENQVFIGMFRPDPDAKPRWFGNLKRYQLVANGAGTELGDVNGDLAVNSLTGFVTPCATSYWTTDSGSYWSGLGINPDPAGACATTSLNPYSDAPDGPLVEKGAVAQILRQGNSPPSTASSPTWAVNRTLYTASGTSLTPFSTASSGLSDALVRFIRGEDVNDEKGTGATTTTRPSIHGDVIHSRPLPVNYGSSGVTVFYGANDGYFRAVNAATGAERWGFVAPEFFSRLARLNDNSPLVSYPNLLSSTVPTPTAKDYFYDGSTGVYQNADSSKVWVLPTMRRGGRMIYELDVTNADAPRIKWKAGCPNLGNDTGCTAGMSGIGQTWSTPAVAFVKGYSTTRPLVLVGGGYDGCEDADSTSPGCGATKGGMVYILDGEDGSVVASFATLRAVASDITMVDIDNDGMPDYAYAADTGGNLYRVDFVASPTTMVALASSAWTMHQVAFTNGGFRKFLFAPALLAVKTKVYVAIGSGDREHPLQSQYPYENVRNRFYVYQDDLTLTAATPPKNLDTNLEDYSSNTSCTTPMVLPNSTLNGWFMDLPGKGEQVVTSALIASGMVTFSTNRPVPATAASCATSLGVATGYWVNLFNAAGAVGVTGSCDGARSAPFAGGGLPPSPVLATGVPVNGRAVSVVIGAVQRDGTASAAISPQKVRPVIKSKRKISYSYSNGP